MATAARMAVAATGSRGASVPIREIWDVTVARKHPNPALQAIQTQFHFLVRTDQCPTKAQALNVPRLLGYILDPRDYVIDAIESAEIVDIPDAPANTPAAESPVATGK